MQNKPQVGIGVIVIRDNKVLAGKRRNSHGDGTWGFLGGHLNFNETWEECATREVMEETGIRVKNIRFGTATNDIFPTEKKHYITIFMLADYDSGDVKIMEPEKCDQWAWFEWEKLPTPLFVSVQNLFKAKYNPIDPS